MLLFLTGPVAQAGRWGGGDGNGRGHGGRNDDGGGYLVDPRGGGHSNNGMTADEAADRARARYGGRVLSVRSSGDGGSRSYEVKLLNEGQVRVVRIDADR